MNEHYIQNCIRLALSEMGYIVFRINVGKVKMHDGRWFDVGVPKGYSDLTVVKDGRVYYLEVKHGKNKATVEQLNFIRIMRKAGCIAGVVYSVEEAIALVTGVSG